MGSFGRPESLQDEEYQFASEQLPKRNHHKIKAMMVEHHLIEENEKTDQSKKLEKEVKDYLRSKSVPYNNIVRNRDEEGKNDVLMALDIFLDGTYIVKTIKPIHVENFTGVPADEDLDFETGEITF